MAVVVMVASRATGVVRIVSDYHIRDDAICLRPFRADYTLRILIVQVDNKRTPRRIQLCRRHRSERGAQRPRDHHTRNTRIIVMCSRYITRTRRSARVAYARHGTYLRCRTLCICTYVRTYVCIRVVDKSVTDEKTQSKRTGGLGRGKKYERKKYVNSPLIIRSR